MLGQDSHLLMQVGAHKLKDSDYMLIGTLLINDTVAVNILIRVHRTW